MTCGMKKGWPIETRGYSNPVRNKKPGGGDLGESREGGAPGRRLARLKQGAAKQRGEWGTKGMTSLGKGPWGPRQYLDSTLERLQKKKKAAFSVIVKKKKGVGERSMTSGPRCRLKYHQTEEG